MKIREKQGKMWLFWTEKFNDKKEGNLVWISVAAPDPFNFWPGLIFLVIVVGYVSTISIC